jgi:hypothetical protein
VGRAMSTLLQGSDPGPPFEHLHLERFDHAELERETQVV